MIRNERQYRITKAHADKFARALQEAAARSGIDPLLHRLEQDALRSQLRDLEQDIREYETLQSGQQSVLSLDSFAELPSALVKARIAAGLTQKDLADRLGLKEQQVQRYETTDYASASVTRLKEVIDALSIRIREDVFLASPKMSMSMLFQRLAPVGIGKDFLMERILPSYLSETIAANPRKPSGGDALRAASVVGRVYQWTPEEIFGDSPLRIEATPAGMARFKLPRRAEQRYLSAYTVYAHFSGTLVLKAFPREQTDTIPIDATECRQSIIASFGEITFGNVLKYVWRLGIPVLPLNDSGAFHGACWRAHGRNIIVLKQRTTVPGSLVE